MTEPQPLHHEERTWAGSMVATHGGSRGLRHELVVSNRYRVGALLGAGGMGLVYEAEHHGLGLPVALKVLRPELIDDEAMIARFHQEARNTAKLRGEHVVRVLDQGRLETGLPFFVMERLHGLDLQAVLKACSTLPVVLTIDYARQTCAALAEAHAAGIVHRDIKPSNLFVTSQASEQSRIKLLDFGIAQQIAPDTKGEPLGTTSYAAPEQLDAREPVDHRSDLWSLGVVMFQAVTGTLPFVDGWFGRRRVDLRALDGRADVPDGFRSAIRRCLADDKAARFSSAADLSRALEPVGLGLRQCSADAAAHRHLAAGERRHRRAERARRVILRGDGSAPRSFSPPRRAPARPRPAPHASFPRA